MIVVTYKKILSFTNLWSLDKLSDIKMLLKDVISNSGTRILKAQYSIVNSHCLCTMQAVAHTAR